MGGVAAVSKAESEIVAKFDGIIEYDLKVSELVENNTKSTIVISRSGEIRILDAENNKILTNMHVPYGSFLSVKDKQKSK